MITKFSDKDVRNSIVLHTIAVAASIIVHILVFVKLIPFEYVNGGRSETYNDAKQLSLTSSIILSCIALIPIVLYKMNRNLKYKKILKIISLILIPFWIFSCIQQFFGTIFEIIAMSVICFTGFIASLYMYLSLKSSIKKENN